MKHVVSKFRNDKGAALVIVLLLVAVMAAAAAVTFEALGYSVKSSTARRMYDQARYYALGGEQLAVAAAEKLVKAKVKLIEPRTVSYPIDGGRIDGVISDASNCFNVNSVVERSDSGALQRRERTAFQFERIVSALGYSDREAVQLTAALVDWIDTDVRPGPSGAEDYDYGALSPAYRTPNGLMVDLSELQLVRGFTGETLASLKPLLCVSDNTAEMVLNVNTLRVEQAPLLAALVGGNLTLSKAADLIAARPSRGYDEVAYFWDEQGFAGLTIDGETRAQTAIKPNRLESRIRVTYHEAISHLTSVIHVDNGNNARLLSHRFGVVQ